MRGSGSLSPGGNSSLPVRRLKMSWPRRRKSLPGRKFSSTGCRRTTPSYSEMAFSFRYKNVPRNNGTAAYSPSFPVTLKASSSVTVPALVDSGADISVMPLEVAEIIGCDLSGPVDETFGIGGSARVKRTSVHVAVRKGHEHYSIRVPFCVLLDDAVPVLLGRAAFFDAFDITFKQSRNQFSLKRVVRP